jgi:hypothetical protein
MELSTRALKLQTRQVRSTSVKQAHSFSPSLVERLPLELRQEIYGYFGVPIGRKFYSDMLGYGTVLRYTFGHWNADLAMTGKYRYSGTTYSVYSSFRCTLPRVYERTSVSHATFVLDLR